MMTFLTITHIDSHFGKNNFSKAGFAYSDQLKDKLAQVQR